MNEILCLKAASLAAVPHGFLGNCGGVSSGIFTSLNVGLGSSDDPAHVEENRRRSVHTALPGAALTTVHQVHSATCVVANAPWPDAARPRADAIATNRAGLLLGVLTADCAPVLFADVKAGVVAAAHAGWGGALAGVIEATVTTMETLGAKRSNIHAAVGPCIAKRSYEVDAEFRYRFIAAADAHAHFFSSGQQIGKFQFDLEAFVLGCLSQSEIGRAHV